MLEITDEIRELIANRASEQVIRKAATRAGMRTMFQDGLEKAAQGLTTVDEVLRVVSPDELERALERWPRSTSDNDSSDASATGVPDQAAVPGGDVVEPAPSSTRRRRVLVVEDSPTVSAVVKSPFLELEGLDVFVAGNGLVGLEMVLQEHPGRHRQRRQHAGAWAEWPWSRRFASIRGCPTCAS